MDQNESKMQIAVLIDSENVSSRYASIIFNEIETCADPDAHEPELVEIEKHLRKRKYTGQREELVKNLPHSKVLHTIDEREQICDNCGSTMVKGRIRPHGSTVYPCKTQGD